MLKCSYLPLPAQFFILRVTQRNSFIFIAIKSRQGLSVYKLTKTCLHFFICLFQGRDNSLFNSGNPSFLLSLGETRRKPILLLRLSGVLLLRFALRQLFALLFQLPPRFTRLEPLRLLPCLY
jgi:hypothetical protein